MSEFQETRCRDLARCNLLLLADCLEIQATDAIRHSHAPDKTRKLVL